ncbi:MAG: hypothetical protein P4L72_16260 [Parvibaculum sp.]|uniref:hypothetical protein n=1 Tax=Parvibaculum sp. TaxID=2024848 RepID=UPI00283DDAF4|nr:hypothetical protein [Parvibaculum sp.]MDR3500769.1 hypothetical protein [Parvibaculum sp.]
MSRADKGGNAMIARILAVILLFGGASVVNAASLHAEEKAGGYLDAVEDMPLMEGLHETGEGGIVFDKPNGRIVRAIAAGNVTPAAVRAFYIETLPQLGWKRLQKLELIADLLVFRRDTERLEIQTAPGTDGRTEVRFSIEPD